MRAGEALVSPLRPGALAAEAMIALIGALPAHRIERFHDWNSVAVLLEGKSRVASRRQRSSSAMCDYSLHHVKSRPAKVGDKLMTRNFSTGTRGFAAPDDPTTAVCVLPEQSLLLPMK
jgi:hypothetical protein